MLAESSGVKITSLTLPGTQTAVDIAGGETVTVTGSGFNTGITAYVNTTSCTTTYVSGTSLTFVTPALSAATYNLMVYNTDGSTGTKPGALLFSSPPVWVTAAGALLPANTNVAYSQTVNATGTGITYSITSGALPTGLSLNSSSGEITGTPTVANTFNFTITATNTYNQLTARAFSIAVSTAVPASILVIGAGGAGGTGYYGGGGGAGGYIESSTSFLLSITYTITIGAGGTASGATNIKGNPGGNTSITGSGFTTITAVGGGGGGSRTDANAPGAVGGNGGSGGGASYVQNAGGIGVYPGSTYINATRQGYDGGSSNNDNTYSAGGGGAGGPGQGATGTPPRAAGPGLASSITGTSVYRGGGGGNAYGTSYPGTGGGGAANTAGSANTGGGGGGGSGNAAAGGTGGTGVVIIKFPDSFPAATTTGSPTVTSITGYRIYTFTGTGTISFN